MDGQGETRDLRCVVGNICQPQANRECASCRHGRRLGFTRGEEHRPEGTSMGQFVAAGDKGRVLKIL